MADQGGSDEHSYLAREALARVEIDKQLAEAGWLVQSQDKLNLGAGVGVAVREFTLEKPHGRVDYLLFLNGQPAGVIAAEIVDDLEAALAEFAEIAASLGHSD